MNHRGQLGIGGKTRQLAPVQVAPAQRFVTGGDRVAQHLRDRHRQLPVVLGRQQPRPGRRRRHLGPATRRRASAPRPDGRRSASAATSPAAPSPTAPAAAGARTPSASSAPARPPTAASRPPSSAAAPGSDHRRRLGHDVRPHHRRRSPLLGSQRPRPGRVQRRATPRRRVAVQGARTYKSVTVGDSFGCGVTTASEAICWGSNRYGQLGDGQAGLARRRPQGQRYVGQRGRRLVLGLRPPDVRRPDRLLGQQRARPAGPRRPDQPEHARGPAASSRVLPIEGAQGPERVRRDQLQHPRQPAHRARWRRPRVGARPAADASGPPT